MTKKGEKLDLTFPKGEHENCRTLSQLTIEQIPSDGVLGTSYEFRKRSFIWKPGDRSDKIYFLKKGRVIIFGVDREGREIILANVGEAEPFGELCFCGGPTEERHTTARADSDCHAFEITLEDFVGYLQKDSEVLGKFLFTICVRLSHSEKRIGILALRSVEERLGHTILLLARTQGRILKAESDENVELNVTHEELSGFSALSRQRVTLCMNRFRKLGLVKYSRKSPLSINLKSLSEHLHENI